MSELEFNVVIEASEVDVTVEEPVVAAVLVAGPAGPPGPNVPVYEHVQSTPAATWSVSHGLGKFPISSEITVGGELVFADIIYPSTSTVVVTFASPQAGILRLI